MLTTQPSRLTVAEWFTSRFILWTVYCVKGKGRVSTANLLAHYFEWEIVDIWTLTESATPAQFSSYANNQSLLLTFMTLVLRRKLQK